MSSPLLTDGYLLPPFTLNRYSSDIWLKTRKGFSKSKIEKEANTRKEFATIELLFHRWDVSSKQGGNIMVWFFFKKFPFIFDCLCPGQWTTLPLLSISHSSSLIGFFCKNSHYECRAFVCAESLQVLHWFLPFTFYNINMTIFSLLSERCQKSFVKLRNLESMIYSFWITNLKELTGSICCLILVCRYVFNHELLIQKKPCLLQYSSEWSVAS